MIAIIASIIKSLIEIINYINAPTHIRMGIAIVVNYIRPGNIRGDGQYSCRAFFSTFQFQAISKSCKFFKSIIESSVSSFWMGPSTQST